MTQTKAPKGFGITQPRLNDLLRSRSPSSVWDALVTIAAAGLHVPLRVRKVA